MSGWFDAGDRAVVAAALEEAVPGSVEMGAVEYVVCLLTALDHDPPRIWAAPDGGAEGWLELGPWERQAWSVRIAGWRDLYARVAGGTAEDDDLRVVFEHACEATYGDPAYGGNHDGAAWAAVSFPEPLFPPRRSGSVRARDPGR